MISLFFRRNAKSCSAKLSCLRSMLLWIRKKAKNAGFNDSETKKIELVCEEALVNIIRHAYKSRRGKIEIHTRKKREYFDIVIKDQGPFFNPLYQNRSIDYSASLEQRKAGGLGILLMCQYMDKIDYHREDPYNILILHKKIY
ncbi:MAG: anti-sigma regulatory factor [Parachlamydiales bacterium]|nr:anti-sigma regulatory factor [Parachlamydiales bacterium]